MAGQKLHLNTFIKENFRVKTKYDRLKQPIHVVINFAECDSLVDILISLSKVPLAVLLVIFKIAMSY